MKSFIPSTVNAVLTVSRRSSRPSAMPAGRACWSSRERVEGEKIVQMGGVLVQIKFYWYKKCKKWPLFGKTDVVF